MLCLLGHLGRSGGARRQRQRTRANWSRRGAISSGVSAGGSEPIVQVLRRFVPDMQDLFAQLERQLGEGDVQGSAATLHYHQGQRFHRWRHALAGRASELEQALRRADCCAAWKSSPASASTNCALLCDARLLRLQAMFGDVQAESAS